MPSTYLCLCNFNNQGAVGEKQPPERIQLVAKAAEKLNIKFLYAYLTLGEYDLVFAFEGPDNHSAAEFAVAAAGAWNLKTETLATVSESTADTHDVAGSLNALFRAVVA